MSQNQSCSLLSTSSESGFSETLSFPSLHTLRVTSLARFQPPSGERSQVTALEAKGWKRLEGVTTETLLKPCGKLLSDTSGDSQLPSSTPSILEFPGQDVLRGLTARPGRGGDGLPPSGKRGPSTRWWSDLKFLQGFFTLPGTFRLCRAGGRARSGSDLKPGTTVVGVQLLLGVQRKNRLVVVM